MGKWAWSIAFFCWSFLVVAQHDIRISASLDAETRVISIFQEINYVNTHNTTLDTLYFYDWANSFSSKTTPLAKRFAENFRNGFHFEKDENRGRTDIENVTDTDGTALHWERGDQVDIVRLVPKSPVQPGQSYTFYISYKVKLPEDRFTRYGYTKDNDFRLKYWYISPCVYDGKWITYSNKNTFDQYQLPSNYTVNFTFPLNYHLTTDLDLVAEVNIGTQEKMMVLEGNQRMQLDLYLEQNPTFQQTVTDQLELVSNLADDKVTPAGRAILEDRVTRFLTERLGPYPFKKLMVSKTDYKNSPVYGLNQLPDFVSPFPNGFELDAELLKTISREYLVNTLPLNPRKDHWLLGALQIYLMTEYMDTYYPEMKLMGSASEFWIIRWSHAATLEFNDQYSLLYLNMARNNLHQSLVTPRDSLVKFNKNIASDYYAGQGFRYLGSYLGKAPLDETIREFYGQQLLKTPDTEDFQQTLQQNTTLPIDWFFSDYVGKRTTIDFKIESVEALEDSLKVTIINRRDNTMPVDLSGLDKERNVLFSQWLAPIDSSLVVTVPKEGVRKLVLNNDGIIPEFNRRNNTRKVKGFLNRPVQFRLFQDIEDPNYNQLFIMPEFTYNLYDGITVGPKLYNKTFLPKGVHYKLIPLYGFNSQKLIGKGSISYTGRLDKGNHYATRMGLAGSFFSYNTDLFYRRLSPFITFGFRDNTDLRKNKKQFINVRNVNVFRDEDPNDPDQDPNYSVFNAQYVYSDKNLVNYYRGVADYQINKDFSKLSVQFEYRKLFNSNQQLNLRLYAGTFLYNNTNPNSNFFSFALDRPSDYLFDYNYYGRSEDTGLFSQQLIVAEGGFKSQLEPAYANQFIATINASTNIWKWIFLYGDVGLVKNKGQSIESLWDSGIRASLVADYFEIYFPLYSSLGWEPGLPNYDQKIRFIVTLDLQTLFGLFTREWY